ncbi:MAG: type II toxin-antitoxin system RelE/ParE family toxin [Pirellulales bacterium]
MNDGATRRTIVFANAAVSELEAIRDWNARRYGAEHARRYLDFLRSRIHLLETQPERGTVTPGCDDLRYLVMRRHARGFGHIAVYEILVDDIMILHVFHTSEDWSERLREERSEPR